MTVVSSNLTAARRITPQDEAYLRRFRAEMKFTTAGPFAKLLDPIRAPKPGRDKAGNIVDPQPRYAARSAESWLIGSRLPTAVVTTLVSTFGRELNSVLDDEPTPVAPKRRRRRGSRGGRKPVAS